MFSVFIQIYGYCCLCKLFDIIIYIQSIHLNSYKLPQKNYFRVSNITNFKNLKLIIQYCKKMMIQYCKKMIIQCCKKLIIQYCKKKLPTWSSAFDRVHMISIKFSSSSPIPLLESLKNAASK